MASSNPPSSSLSPDFAAAFRRLAGDARTLRFDAFMRLALYDEYLGYYRRDRLRVARDRSADFYTATSLGPIFGELVSAAAVQLLTSAGLDPAIHRFVEIGAEPTGGVLRPDLAHPFVAIETRRIGEPLALAGPCVVFSNELFDAQPLRRFIQHKGVWHEQGVALTPDALNLTETDLGPAPAEVLDLLPPLATTPDGYRFDAPIDAAILARELAALPWHGLFIAFDYGKSFAELGHSSPAGTARAYYQHTQHNDLFARPGEQDLTAHVCWDWLEKSLFSEGCLTPQTVSQESFFVHHAGSYIAAHISAKTSAIDPAKRALLHLLHPGQMGQKFQVLHAIKPAPATVSG